MNEEQIRAEFEATFPNLRHEKTEYDDDIYLDRHTGTMYHGFHKGYRAALSAKSVLPNQEPLGSEFEKVLYENLNSLYETDVATQLPTDDRVRELERSLELFRAATSQELHERIAEIMKEDGYTPI